MIKLAALVTGLGILVAKIKSIIGFIGKNWSRVSPIIVPLIQQVEQASLNGKVTKDQRKQILLNGITIAEQQGLIKKPSFPMSIIFDKIEDIAIDKIASNLPDFQISQQAQTIINQAILTANDIAQKSTQAV